MNVDLQLDWIRHGFSCANLLQEGSKISSAVRPLITKDAALSSQGVVQAKKLNQEILLNHNNRYDIVICSNLRRAMETAIYGFSGVKNVNGEQIKIYVSPFISENRNAVAEFFNLDQENVPSGSKILKKYYDDHYRNSGIPVDFSILELYEKKNVDLSPDYKQFIKRITRFINRIKSKSEGKIRIAIVSHNHFISNHIKENHKIKMGNLNNTEMWRENLVLNYKIRLNSVKHVDSSNCPTGSACRLYPGVKPPSGDLDVGRCSTIHGSPYRIISKSKFK